MARPAELTSPRRLGAQNRRRRVLALRLEGLQFHEIADRLKAEGLADPDTFKTQHAYRDLLLELSVARSLTAEDRETVRKLELERLDVLLGRLWREYETANMISHSKALGEVAGPALHILDRILKVQERRAKYLGLDEPEKHEVKFDDTTITAVVDKLLAILTARVTDPDTLALLSTDLRSIDWGQRPALTAGLVVAEDDDETSV